MMGRARPDGNGAGRGTHACANSGKEVGRFVLEVDLRSERPLHRRLGQSQSRWYSGTKAMHECGTVGSQEARYIKKQPKQSD